MTSWGGCAALYGDLAEAGRARREVAAAQRQSGDGQQLALVLRRLAMVYELQGAYERALACHQETVELFAAQGLPGEAAAERLAIAAHLRRAGQLTQALQSTLVAKEEGQLVSRRDLVVRALEMEGAIRCKLGEHPVGLDRLRMGLEFALEAELTTQAASLYLELGLALDGASDYLGARETLSAAVTFCRERGVADIASACLACLSATLTYTGEWDQAAALCQEVLTDKQSLPDARVTAAATFGAILAWRGEARRARQLLQQAAHQARQQNNGVVVIWNSWPLGYLDELEGASLAACEHARFVLARWSHVEDRAFIVAPLCWAVSLFARLGERDDAQACAQALNELATAGGNREALAGLALALGEVAFLQADWEQAATQFTQSSMIFQELGLPYLWAHTQWRAGTTLAAAGQRGGAVERLADAYRTATRLRAQPLAARCAQELAALGESIEQRLGRRARRHIEHVDLSLREQEVVQQIALGRTNREIAQHLFLSTRTVDMHVRNILSKLGCRSRAEAVHKVCQMSPPG